ncbi:Hypothetical protein, putative, partial [Bodo saltans]
TLFMSHNRREIPHSLVKSLSLASGNDALLGADSAAGMRKMRERIDQFFTDASNAPPPQSIENEEEKDEVQYEHEVHLSLIAGVLEAKKAPQLQRVDGVVLPTTENLERLDAEKMRDSHALLNMFAALRNPSGDGAAAAPNGAKRQRQKRRHQRVVEGSDDADVIDEEAEGSSSGSDSECVIMNASSCSDT